MKRILTLFLVIRAVFAFAQTDEVLLTINDRPVYLSEFKSIYEKNLSIVNDKEKDIDKNLELFIDYKLKVNEAYRLKLDTLRGYKREFKTYRDQLVIPYLKDKNLHDKLLKEAYDRTKNEIRASHILMLTPEGEKIDTTKIINTLNDARKRILAGESFDKVAKEVSQDPSAKVNGGDLGFFTAFKMIYEFEDKAYNTKVGDVSKPFKTKFGYHIVKVTDKRISKGEFDTAHILVKDTSNKGKKRIDSIYSALKTSISFFDLAKKVSEDTGTKPTGGKLPKFGSGVMVKPFEEAVLQLQKEGEYSKPFKTQFGWHIVKLLKHYPVLPFEQLKLPLENKMKKDSRGKLSEKVIIDRLKKEYKITFYEKAASFFKGALNHDHAKGSNHSNHNHKVRFNTKKTVQDELLMTINNKKITQTDLYNFSKLRRYRRLYFDEMIEKFKEEQILEYYKENIEKINSEFKSTLMEYRQGLLLFELLQRKIWDQANNKEKLDAYYENHKSNYKKPLSAIRGKVSGDFQKFLEESFISKLKKNSKVKVNKRVLKKFKKQYK